MGWIGCDDWARIVAALAQFAHQRQRAEERDAERGRKLLAAAMREDLVAMVALAAQVVAHVLDDAENRDVNFLEHGDSALDVEQRDPLPRGPHHAARQR